MPPYINPDLERLAHKMALIRFYRENEPLSDEAMQVWKEYWASTNPPEKPVPSRPWWRFWG